LYLRVGPPARLVDSQTRIQFRECKHHSVTIRGINDCKQRKVFASQLFAKLNSRSLQYLAQSNAFKGRRLTIVILRSNGLPRKFREVGCREFRRTRNFAGNSQDWRLWRGSRGLAPCASADPAT